MSSNLPGISKGVYSLLLGLKIILKHSTPLGKMSVPPKFTSTPQFFHALLTELRECSAPPLPRSPLVQGSSRIEIWVHKRNSKECLMLHK